MVDKGPCCASPSTSHRPAWRPPGVARYARGVASALRRARRRDGGGARRRPGPRARDARAAGAGPAPGPGLVPARPAPRGRGPAGPTCCTSSRCAGPLRGGRAARGADGARPRAAAPPRDAGDLEPPLHPRHAAARAGCGGRRRRRQRGRRRRPRPHLPVAAHPRRPSRRRPALPRRAAAGPAAGRRPVRAVRRARRSRARTSPGWRRRCAGAASGWCWSARSGWGDAVPDGAVRLGPGRRRDAAPAVRARRLPGHPLAARGLRLPRGGGDGGGLPGGGGGRAGRCRR